MNNTTKNNMIMEEKNMETKANKILDLIKGMTDNEIMYIWNEYCYESSSADDVILDAGMLEEWLENAGEDSFNILNRFYFGFDQFDEKGSANPNRNYFTFNGYGNIISFDYLRNSYSEEFNYIYIENLIGFIIENENALYNDEIQEILDEE